MGLVQEFKQFVVRGNVIDLAVAVVLGAAFTKIVTAFVDGIIMPIVGAVLPGGDWRTFTVTPLGIKLGSVLAATIDFLLVALVVFLVVNKLMGSFRKKDEVPAAKSCPECLEMIPLAARRCRACTATLA